MSDSIPVICANYDTESMAVYDRAYAGYRCMHCLTLCETSDDHYTDDYLSVDEYVCIQSSR